MADARLREEPEGRASPPDEALFAFPPDGARAAFFHRRLAGRLAESVGEIAAACRGKLAFDEEAVARTCAEIAQADEIGTIVYTLYFDLLAAARRSDAAALTELFDRIPRTSLASHAFTIRRWGDPDFDPDLASRYLRFVNVDPASRVVFSPVDPAVFVEVSGLVGRAFALLGEAAPEIGSEVRQLVRDLVLVSSPQNEGMAFDGATSFHCWGALFLNADEHRTLVDVIDGLSHESAHAHLFGLSFGDPFVTNPPSERHPSPLRVDPRPLDGIFHATYVSARMHYAHHRLLTAGAVSNDEEAQARKGRAAGRRAFFDGLATLDAHARLTPTGERALAGARAYMAPFA